MTYSLPAALDRPRVVLQVVLWLGIGFWRHWLAYRSLQGGLPGVAGDTVSLVDGRPRAGNGRRVAGLRPFRVERRVVEDGAQTVCSFYLVPEDGEALPSFLPGQFLTFRLDVSTAEGASEQIIRCYSCRMPHARITTVFQSSAYRHLPVAMCPRAVPRTTFTIRSQSAVSCRCARRAAISILTAAMHPWC